MSITKMDHVNILTPSAEKTAAFYRDVLGFSQVSQNEKKGMKIINMQLGSDVLEIIEPTEGNVPPRNGFKHLALTSDDIQADFAALKASGCNLLHKEVQESGALRFFFIAAPGGEWVEIIQEVAE